MEFSQPVWVLIVEGIFFVFSGALLWRIFIIQQYIKEMHDTVKYNRDRMHEMQACIHNHTVELGRLREEHRDIQNSQSRADEKADKFSDVVSSKVETIMRDHAQAEVVQARIEEMVKNIQAK